MKRAVITTTIYRPDNLTLWAAHMKPGDLIVVSGDEKTPHNDVKYILDSISDMYSIETLYVVTTDTRTSRAVPMRSIQRRNVATLEAIRRNVNIITTVDTDNFPIKYGTQCYVDAVEDLLVNPWTDVVIGSSTEWVNVGEWCTPPVIHRGWPLGVKSDHVEHKHDNNIRVGVHASLWLGDPDITALERLLHDPQIIDVVPHAIALEPDVWCPFNSQATSYRRELFPLLNVWPGVGRMDDIWPSYVARHIMNHLDFITTYGAPNVIQMRHKHNAVTDLENEIIGYRNTDYLLREIRQIDLSNTDNALDALEVVLTTLWRRMRYIGVIPDITYDFWVAWITDLRDFKMDGIL
jgi:hypothetical protein